MIYLLCGPPCAGKTTLALEAASPSDQIIDFDAICTELDKQPGWTHTKPIRERAAHIMNSRIRALHRPTIGDAYVIRAAPDPLERTRLARSLQAQVWLLNPGPHECLRRAHTDGRPARTAQAITDWYTTYRPARVDRRPPEVA